MKPSTSDGYDPVTTLQAKATCLYVATKLGDLMDEMVVVVGLVPSLLITQDGGAHSEAHVGTMDVDLALNVETAKYGSLRDGCEFRWPLLRSPDADDWNTPSPSVVEYVAP